MNVAKTYADELRENLPVTYEGLRFKPLSVKHFALYQNAKPAMELLLSSLPVRYARLSWMTALDEMDREAARENLRTGYVASILLLLDAALQLNAAKNPRALMVARTKEGKLSALVVQQEQGTPTALTEKHFKSVREILAAQNGYEIPDENWNPELVRAQQYLRGQRSSGAGGSLEDAVYALAAATGFRAGEIWNWPIREYLGVQSAVDRRLRFQLYTEAELTGKVKFKGGNPCPTWISPSRSGLPTGFQSLKALDEGAHGLMGTPNDT